MYLNTNRPNKNKDFEQSISIGQQGWAVHMIYFSVHVELQVQV